MMLKSDAVRRRELGAFVRAQRERVTPAEVGVSGAARRRTPGLRREEVAQLSGISATWYIWIEQGRDVSVSPMALSRLAMALRLTRSQRAYLFGLAGKRDPEQAIAAIDAAGGGLQDCVDAIHAPAYVLDRHWDARGWNMMAAHLFTGWLDSESDKNLLRFIFLNPTARMLIDGWEERARRVVAEFRVDAGSQLNDTMSRRLIDDLLAQSPAFAGFWHRHDVLGREGGERTFNHPTDGFLRYEQLAFNLTSQPDLKLTILLGPERSDPDPPMTELDRRVGSRTLLDHGAPR
jgi:transcriptional regulator with XRE-family HTH domain